MQMGGNLVETGGVLPPLRVPHHTTPLYMQLLPLGRKARSMLSGCGGGAPRPPATLSYKADPEYYPGGFAFL